jgi:hypothetical protein
MLPHSRQLSSLLNSLPEQLPLVPVQFSVFQLFKKSVALDEHGAAASSQPSTLNQQQSAKVTVRHKSGVVLYQP